MSRGKARIAAIGAATVATVAWAGLAGANTEKPRPSDRRAQNVNYVRCSDIGLHAADGWIQYPMPNDPVGQGGAVSGTAPGGAFAYAVTSAGTNPPSVPVLASGGTWGLDSGILNVVVGPVQIGSVVVKGGNQTQVYQNVELNMISPLNVGFVVPAISHWFVCYKPTPPPVETTTTIVATTLPPVTEPPVTEPPVTEPPATEPPATEPPTTLAPTTAPPTTDEESFDDVTPTTQPPTTLPPTTVGEEESFDGVTPQP